MKSRAKTGSAGPSAGELRMRGELDQLRREVAKLRRIVSVSTPDPEIEARSAAAEAPGVESTATGSVASAPEAAEPVVAPRSTATDSSGDAAAAPPDSADGATLRTQVKELAAAKQRLSRLYFQQLEENRRRSQKLHVILENIGRINSELDLDSLLNRLADTIRQSLGFHRVLIRVREPGTGRLRAQAFAGIENEGRQKLEQQDVTMEQCLSWLKDEFRIGQSYFISHAHAFNRELPEGWSPGLGPREAWEWHEDDVLIVPLFNRGGELVAYFSVDDPDDRLVPSQEVVELLEIYGHHAMVALENARLYRQLESHSHELEDTQRQHHEMHQLKANFLSTVSHELRTPVTAIRAFVDTMLGAGYGEITHAQMRHFLSIINEETQRLSRLIESLLDLNRYDSGVLRLSRQPVDLVDIMRETLDLLDPMAQVGRVALKVESHGADTRVDASRDQMRQLALHLGGNAVKFTPAGGTVTFVLTGDDREVGLEVVDTGIGIPRESLERIFERFYQVDSTLVRRFGGTGLGLAICKSIVEWHGGRIHAESTPGRGSSFVVAIPRRTRPRVLVQPGPEPEAAVGDILRLAIEMAAEVMGARVVSLLCPEVDGQLVIRAAIGLDEDVVRRARVAPGDGVAGYVAKHRRPVCVSGSEAHPEVAGSGRAFYRSRTFLSAPIEQNGVLLGVLNATDPTTQEQFDAEDCYLFLQLAQRIAAAWRQALDAQQQQAGVADTANTLRQLLQHLERGRRNAPNRVRLARALARELGLQESEVAIISFAASVHDVGMRTLGENIVEGAGSLSDEERRQVERHPEAGAELLAPLETAGGVRELVLSHQERWDGRGYPRGLKGEEIPIGGRILAVVDAFESMTVGRPHRPAVPRDDALHEIDCLAGGQFDPRVVAAVRSALEQVDRQAGNEVVASDSKSLADPGR